jgi:hypothetical protein
MNTKPWDTSGEARKALHGIVTDPQYGAAALSQPVVMTNLLKDMLPDEPREAGLLVAAAQADLAGALRGYVTQGLDADTAVSLTATSFVNSTSHTREASDWVVNELALALGLKAPAARFDQPTVPPAPPAPTVAVPVAPVPPVPQPYQPGAQPYQPVPQPYQPGAQPYQPGPQSYQPGPQSYQPVPPGPWQPSPWTVPPKPASPGRGAAVGAGIVSFAGALLVLIGCLVPFARFSPGEPAFGILLGHSTAPSSYTFWLAAEPMAVLLISVVAGISMIATGGRSLLLPGMLIAFGIQTTLFFAGAEFTLFAPSTHMAGGYLGLLGGLALLVAGLIGRTATRTSVPAVSTPGVTVPGPGPIPGPGPTGPGPGPTGPGPTGPGPTGV